MVPHTAASTPSKGNYCKTILAQATLIRPAITKATTRSTKAHPDGAEFVFPYLVLSAIGLVPSRTTRVRGLLEKLSTTSTCTAPCRAPCATLPATDTLPICPSIIPPTHRPKLTPFPFPERDCALFSVHQSSSSVVGRSTDDRGGKQYWLRC